MKKILLGLKYVLSIGLYFFGVSSLINKLIKLRYGNLPALTVLCYHSIDKLQAAQFELQLDYLLEHSFQFVSKEQLMELIKFPTKFNKRTRYICLTFDDCYEDNYTVVRPILLRKKIPAIFFAVSSKLGKMANWENRSYAQRLMSRGQLKEIALTFDIGAHTQNHVRLSELKPDAILKEIINSKKELAEILKQEISLFAYPNGCYNPEVLNCISQCHFEAAFTIDQHTNYSYNKRYTLGRYLISLNSFMSFKLKVMGGYDWFFFLKKLLAWH